MAELTVALIAPTLGGVISIFLWLNKRNSETIQKSFDLLHSSTSKIEVKVDAISLDVAKNYVTNEDLATHIKGEEDWHKIMHDEVKDIKTDVRQTREILNRMIIESGFNQ